MFVSYRGYVQCWIWSSIVLICDDSLCTCTASLRHMGLWQAVCRKWIHHLCRHGNISTCGYWVVVEICAFTMWESYYIDRFIMRREWLSVTYMQPHARIEINCYGTTRCLRWNVVQISCGRWYADRRGTWTAQSLKTCFYCYMPRITSV